MKKFLFLIILMVASTTAHAHQSTSAEVRMRMVEAKTKYMIRTLHITKEQQAKFIEIYHRYNKNMRGLWSGNQDTKKTGNTQDEADRIKRRLANQKRAIEIQMATIDELAQVLNADQLSRFLDTEREIQQRVKARREQGAKTDQSTQGRRQSRSQGGMHKRTRTGN